MGSKFLKVTGIIMIIGGALSIILGILSLVGTAAISELVDLGAMYYVALILAVISGILELITGIAGVKNCNKPEKANTCILLAGLTVACSILSQVLTMVAVSNIDGVSVSSNPVTSILLGLILPGLYIFGAIKNKSASNS